jgi:hypothetical protein
MFASHVEGPAAAAFKRVFDDGYSLDAPGRRAAISMFLAFQCVRSRGTRNDLVQQHQTAAKAIADFATPESLRSYVEKRGQTITDEEMADVAKYARLGQYEMMVERAANLHLDILVQQALEMVPYISGRTWIVRPGVRRAPAFDVRRAGHPRRARHRRAGRRGGSRGVSLDQSSIASARYFDRLA